MAQGISTLGGKIIPLLLLLLLSVGIFNPGGKLNPFLGVSVKKKNPFLVQEPWCGNLDEGNFMCSVRACTLSMVAGLGSVLEKGSPARVL